MADGKVLRFPLRRPRCAACGDFCISEHDGKDLYVCPDCQDLHIPQGTIFSCSDGHPTTGMFWVTDNGVECSVCGRTSSFTALAEMTKALKA